MCGIYEYDPNTTIRDYIVLASGRVSQNKAQIFQGPKPFCPCTSTRVLLFVLTTAMV